MPLTAADAAGRPIWPFEDGVTRASCRDPTCRADVAAVREVDNDLAPRVKHWRHVVHTAACPSARREGGDRITEWHRTWQAECVDAARVEVRVERDGKHRVADLMTHFGWAVELQHSQIGHRVYQARTDHYRGRVVWVFDCATTNVEGDLEMDGGRLRWLDRRVSNSSGHRQRRDGLICLDDGAGIWLLPPDLRGVRVRDGSVELSKSLCSYWTRARFIDRWVNGDQMPLEEPVHTSWVAAEQAARRERQQREAARPVLPKRAADYAEAPGSCLFSGARDTLIRTPPPPMRVTWTPAPPMPPGPCHGYACQQEAPPGSQFCPGCDAKGREAVALFRWRTGAA